MLAKEKKRHSGRFKFLQANLSDSHWFVKLNRLKGVEIYTQGGFKKKEKEKSLPNINYLSNFVIDKIYSAKSPVKRSEMFPDIILF